MIGSLCRSIGNMCAGCLRPASDFIPGGIRAVVSPSFRRPVRRAQGKLRGRPPSPRLGCRAIGDMCSGCLRTPSDFIPGGTRAVVSPCFGRPVRRAQDKLRGRPPSQQAMACLRQTPLSISQSASSTRITDAFAASKFLLPIFSLNIARSAAECSRSASM